MSNQTRHPDDLELLRYVDGELSSREARRVRQHLETCWQCRADLEGLERTIGECVHYRNQVLRPNLPSPPAPWMDIYAAFSRVDSAPGRASFFQGMVRALRGPWLIPAAVAVAVMGILLFEWRETPSVQAAELLRKAVVAADQRPAKVRRIRIQTSSRKLTRVVGMKAAAAGDDDALAAMFRSARYDWNDPLSAKAFESWRDQLPEKSDRVETAAAAYTIRTSTDSGELASASLKLRAGDLQPVEGRLEFRNKETVEITELPPEPSLAETLPDPVAVATGEAPAAAVESIETHPAPAATASGELQVLAALHDVGADLGDPVEVNRTPGSIVVSGVGVAPDRQEKIRAALRPIPNVDIRFSEPAALPGAPAPSGALQAQPSAEGVRLQTQVERYLGGRAQFDTFSGQLLEASEAAMSRAYALRRLAQRFPSGSEGALDASSRSTLARMCREHIVSMMSAEANIAALAGPVMSSLGGRASAVQQKSTDSRAWQPATEELFRSAQRVERLLATMLDGSPKAAPAADTPSKLLTAIGQLRSTMENYRQLLSLEPAGDGR